MRSLLGSSVIWELDPQDDERTGALRLTFEISEVTYWQIGESGYNLLNYWICFSLFFPTSQILAHFCYSMVTHGYVSEPILPAVLRGMKIHLPPILICSRVRPIALRGCVWKLHKPPHGYFNRESNCTTMELGYGARLFSDKPMYASATMATMGPGDIHISWAKVVKLWECAYRG